MREWFLGRVFSSIEDERRRIAYDIHDGLGQSLTLLISGLRSFPDQCDTTELQRRRQDLQAFAERAIQLQGSFEIHSSLGQGCQIVVTVPLPGRTP
ncbi:MAG: histidine kinase [Planctomycetota bacterium]